MGAPIDPVLIAPNRRDVSPVQLWAKLFRIPNLFTVPGDQLAGYCLAGGLVGGRPAGLACAMGAGLCLYAAGLAINDLADIHEDALDRPWRPLATGLLDRVKVEWAAALLLLLALGLAALDGMIMLALVGMLLATVLAYNAWFKRIPVVGNLLMGACRALSLLLGSVAASERLPLPLPAMLGAVASMSYIVAVAVVARSETHPERLKWARWTPLLLCCGWMVAALVQPALFREQTPLFLVLFVMVGFVALTASMGIGRYLRPLSGVKGRRRSILRVSAFVGSMIRALIFVQAMLVLIAVPNGVGVWIAAGITVLWLPSTWLGRTIPSS